MSTPTPTSQPVDAVLEPTFDFDPYVTPHLENPYPALAAARADAPVFFCESMGTWFVTRFDDVAAIMRDTATFSSHAALTNRPGPPPDYIQEVMATGVPYARVAVDADPPEHTRLRGLINRAFTPRRVNGLAPHIREISERLVDAVAADGAADLIEALSHPLPVMVIAELMGLPASAHDDLKRWADARLVLNSGRGGREAMIAAAEATVEFQRYIEATIEQRRAEPREDLISTMVEAAAASDEPIGTPTLVATTMMTLFAGHETTTGLITNTMRHLCLDAELMAAVRNDRSLLPAAITEAIRLDPPLSYMFRTTTSEVEVGGVTLPQGSHLALGFAAANRDPEHFADPDRFDLERENKSDLFSFGRGAHFCVGASLAQLEGRIAIDVLLDRLPDVQLTPEDPYRWTHQGGIRKLDRLELIWTPAAG